MYLVVVLEVKDKVLVYKEVIWWITVPANNLLFAGTDLANNLLLAGTVLKLFV